MTKEEQRQRHIELHQMLDELVADFVTHGGTRPSKTTVLTLMQWSHQQTLEPTELPTTGD